MSFDKIQYHQYYRKKNREWINKKNRDYYKLNPWMSSFYNAKQRCNNPNNPNYPWYGGKGIKFELTPEEIEKIWFRDKAYNMKFPTIDRIKVKENYSFSNCQFLENKENSLKDNVGHWHHGQYIKYSKIGQYDNAGTLIKVWSSQGIASLKLKIAQSDISRCINGKFRQAGGFVWKKL